MRVFEPCKIGSLELKNRLVMSPISTNFNGEGFLTERSIRFFEERARGGVALIVTGDGIVDTPLGNNTLNSLAIDDDKYIPALKKLTRAVHAHGAKVSIQLNHAGRRAGRLSEGYLAMTRGANPRSPISNCSPCAGVCGSQRAYTGRDRNDCEKVRRCSSKSCGCWI